MLRFLGNMPIFRRLFIFFTVAVVVPAILIILLGNFFLSSLNVRGQAVQISFDAQSIASTQLNNLLRMNALLQARFYQVFASSSTEIQDASLPASGGLTGDSIAALQISFDTNLSTYLSNYEVATSDNMSGIKSILLNDNPTTGPGIIQDQQQALTNVSKPGGLWQQYQQLQSSELNKLAVLESNPPKNPAGLLSKYRDVYSVYYNANNAFFNLRQNWQRVVDDAANVGKTVTTVGPSLTNPIVAGSVAAILLTMLVIILTGFIVNLTITNPLRRLVVLTRRVAKGDTNARSKVYSEDEIGKVAIAMNNMLDNIVHLIQQTQAQRDSLQAQVEKLVSEVSGVGEGDLRVQAEVTADALGVLADSFNYMVEELGSLVVRVKMVAQEVENSTTMTFERMSQLVESADTQIKQIGMAAVEVERMAASSRQVAERAQSLSAVAREARQTAQTGRESVLQTVGGMGRINTYVQDTATKVQALGDSSREIDSIVTVIANIAHQTNRLALDAAIQAAMAGDNGKGFGAVAADIRRLAERAKEQASQIARIVRSVREDIGAAAVSMEDTEHETSIGAKLAQEAGSALESIFSVVERQGREIESINLMATQQLQSSNTVVQIMHGVSDSTQRSSYSTRDAAQNMERLARLAEQLLASVEAFKLRDNLNYYAPANITVTPQEQPDNYLTVSGVFRTVTATVQSSDPMRNRNSLPPGNPGAYPPYQQNNGKGKGNGFNGSQGWQQRTPVPPEWQ